MRPPSCTAGFGPEGRSRLPLAPPVPRSPSFLAEKWGPQGLVTNPVIANEAGPLPRREEAR